MHTVDNYQRRPKQPEEHTMTIIQAVLITVLMIRGHNTLTHKQIYTHKSTEDRLLHIPQIVAQWCGTSTSTGSWGRD